MVIHSMQRNFTSKNAITMTSINYNTSLSSSILPRSLNSQMELLPVRLYQRDDKRVLEAEAGCNGQHGVQAAEQGSKQDHLADVRLHGQPCQVHTQGSQLLLPVQSILPGQGTKDTTNMSCAVGTASLEKPLAQVSATRSKPGVSVHACNSLVQTSPEQGASRTNMP